MTAFFLSYLIVSDNKVVLYAMMFRISTLYLIRNNAKKEPAEC